VCGRWARLEAQEQPLDVAAAFTPFDERETRRMQRYSYKAKELGECEMMGKPLRST
jgi:hypothetical protein